MEALGALTAADLMAVMSGYGAALKSHQEALNLLNVYPVPDGDTGTNMRLTIEAVVMEFEAFPDDPPPEVAGVCAAVAHGSLMGARGNSGVILSQLLRGLTGVWAGSLTIDGPAMAAALRAASDAAAQAVLRPVEGTILTVARGAADGAEVVSNGAEAVSNGADAVPHGAVTPLVRVLEGARTGAADALARTPHLLPVLKEAAVVDAGGSGYLLLVDALLSVVDGRPLPDPPVAGARPVAASVPVGSPEDAPGGVATDPAGSAELRYEVMYLLNAPDETIPDFKEVWAGLGDSIVVVGGDGLWNCHIHTGEVGPAIEAALDVGRPRDIRVTDLHEQVDEMRWVREGAVGADAGQGEPAGPPPRTAVVAVANGEGVGRIFRSLGVHHLVAGGQSMNPSTAQILEVVDSLSSPEVVLLPNNDNIRPVAMQVCELSTKLVRTVPTSGIVEGFAALLEYDPEAGAEANSAAMGDSARRVVAGEVTRAVRDGSGPTGPIRAGDYMGLSRDGIEVTGETSVEASCGLLGKLLTDEHELVTLIEGEGATAGDTRRITEWLSEHRPDVVVEVHHGGQPLYPYLLSIE
jgi:DAK2 domain fusion protein YloV